MIDYSLILNKKYNGSEWTMQGEEYEGLQWFSDSPKPTKKELDSQWDEVLSIVENEKIEKESKKAALLEKLGITEDEAKLLLA